MQPRSRRRPGTCGPFVPGQSSFLRPTNSFDLTSNYFLPATLGGDHAFKFGYRWRSAHSTSMNHRGGNADRALHQRRGRTRPTCGAIGTRSTHLDTNAFYLQDTLHAEPPDAESRPALRPPGRRGAGVARCRRNPFVPAHAAGDRLPRRRCRRGVERPLAAPRRRPTTSPATARTVVQRRTATYYGQMAPGQLSSDARGHRRGRWCAIPWTDLNGDRSVQPTRSTSPAHRSRAARRTIRPTRATSAPPARSIRTSRTIARASSSSASIASSATRMAVGASYIWRKYDRFLWDDRLELRRSANYRAVHVHADDGCPAGARCDDHHLLRADDPRLPACVPAHQRAGSLARLQRLRADVRASAWPTAGR